MTGKTIATPGPCGGESLDTAFAARAASVAFLARVGAAAAVALLSAAAHAAVQTFDTPTATTAQTLAVYGLTAGPYLTAATVVDGALRLDAEGNFNGFVGIGAYAMDVSFEFDTRISQSPGSVNVGFAVGDTHVFFHPGYWGRWFAGSAAGGTLRGDFGFTPRADADLHVTVSVDVDAGALSFTVRQGANAASAGLALPGYLPGTTQLGLSAGSVPGDAYYGVFDNLSVTAVPEPAAAASMAAGLVALAAALGARRRRSAHSDRA